MHKYFDSALSGSTSVLYSIYIYILPVVHSYLEWICWVLVFSVVCMIWLRTNKRLGQIKLLWSLYYDDFLRIMMDSSHHDYYESSLCWHHLSRISCICFRILDSDCWKDALVAKEKFQVKADCNNYNLDVVSAC